MGWNYQYTYETMLPVKSRQTANHPLRILYGDKDRLVHFSQSILL